MLTEEEKAYAAGLFDGEGSILIRCALLPPPASKAGGGSSAPPFWYYRLPGVEHVCDTVPSTRRNRERRA